MKNKNWLFKVSLLVMFISLLLMVLVSKCNAQHWNIGAGIGYNTKDLPVFQLNTGINMGRFNLDGIINRGSTFDANTRTYFGGKLGINLLSEAESDLLRIAIIPGFNYAYNAVKWNDNKAHPKNRWVEGYSLRFIRYNRDQSDIGWYIDGMYINKSYQVLVGVHINKIFNL